MTSGERQRRRKARRKDPARAILIGGGALFGAIALMVLAGAAVVAAIAHEVPPLKDLKPLVQGDATTIYYSDGSVAGLIPSTVLRTPIAYSQMPRYVRQATIAIEDQRFWSTGAIDSLSLARAAITDLTSGKTLQGGSTITMQLVRNSTSPTTRRPSCSRSRRRSIAERLEKAHSEDVDPHRATSTTSPTAPSTARPPRASRRRRGSSSTVPRAMTRWPKPHCWRDFRRRQATTTRSTPLAPPAAAQRGALEDGGRYGYITRSRAAVAERAPLELHPNHHYALGGTYLTDLIKSELIKRYGAQRLADGDLKVYTTINPHLGALAKHAINGGPRTCPATPPLRSSARTPPTATSTRSRSRTTTRSRSTTSPRQAQRQPGSTFKAIVLADALAHGIDPFTTDYLSHTLQAGWIPAAPTYTVTIDGGGSLNAAAQPRPGAGRVRQHRLRPARRRPRRDERHQMAYAMGVTTHLNSYRGRGARRPDATASRRSRWRTSTRRSTTAAGATSRSRSRKVVFPDGHVDSELGRAAPRQVLSTRGERWSRPRSSSTTSSTAPRRARRSAARRAAKTGTTSKLVDAWLDGFTPNRTTVVWMGYPKANISMTDVHGQPQFGGLLPADIWHDFMASVVTPPCAQFAPPAADPMTYVPFSGTYQRVGPGRLHPSPRRARAARPAQPRRAAAPAAHTRRR